MPMPFVKFIQGTKEQLYENAEKKNIENGSFIFTTDDERFYLYLNYQL